MSWGFTAIAAATVYSSSQSSSAAQSAAGTQAGAAYAGIDENKRQFDIVQGILAPYAEGGEAALSAQMDLLGINGDQAQAGAIGGIERSPAFSSLVQSGEEAILQNASATGGVRGGNTQGALAQYRPQLLAQLIQQQFSNLGGISSLGQNAAAGTGNAALATGNANASLLAGIGEANAQGIISSTNSTNQGVENLAGLYASGREEGRF